MLKRTSRQLPNVLIYVFIIWHFGAPIFDILSIQSNGDNRARMRSDSSGSWHLEGLHGFT